MPPHADLRTFLEQLRTQHPDWLLEIEDEVPVDFTSTAMAFALEARGAYPVLHFKCLQGHQRSMMANICASRQVMAFSVGATEMTFNQHFGDSLDHLITAQRVGSGPVQDLVSEGNAADVTTLPIPRHFIGDAGPYVTAGMVAARDPDTGVGNLAYARLQIHGPRRLGISIHSRQHLWDYYRRSEDAGVDLEVAAVIGAHPAVMLAAAAKMGIDQDEYDLAGALLGTPLTVCRAKTVDVDVPTHAEIVIEGKMLAGVRQKEGPFGEYTGYSTNRSTDNVLEISAITMREDAIYVDIVPGNSSEHLTLGRASKEAWVHKRMQEALPFFIDFHYPSSGAHFHCYLRIDKTAEGQAKQAAQLLMGLDHYLKLVIVVDRDIDPADGDSVLWALATRMQADKDVTILSNVMGNQLDPSSQDGVGAKMIIDATRSPEFDAERVAVPDDVWQVVQSLLDKKV